MLGMSSDHQNVAAVCTAVVLLTSFHKRLSCSWNIRVVGQAVTSPTFGPKTCVSLCFVGPYASRQERLHDEGDFSSHCEHVYWLKWLNCGCYN